MGNINEKITPKRSNLTLFERYHSAFLVKNARKVAIRKVGFWLPHSNLGKLNVKKSKQFAVQFHFAFSPFWITYNRTLRKLLGDNDLESGCIQVLRLSDFHQTQTVGY
jgi:hypothetical protein